MRRFVPPLPDFVPGSYDLYNPKLRFVAVPKNGLKITYDFDGLKLYVDATSLTYLTGCTVDYLETLEGAGFKFDNPQVKSTCGCGSSFSV